MKKVMTVTMVAVVLAIGMVTTGSAQAVLTKIPVSITTPDKVEAKIGTHQFKDGYPTDEAAAKIRDELDYLHGVEAFMNSIQGVSVYAMRKGLMDIGVKDNEFVICSRLMDSKSLFLTANAQTVYFVLYRVHNHC